MTTKSGKASTNYTNIVVEDELEVGGNLVGTFGLRYQTGLSITNAADTDHDGMPNEWETTWGFDPCNSSDGPDDADGDGYTNVEEYLNGTDPGSGTATGICLYFFLPLVFK